MEPTIISQKMRENQQNTHFLTPFPNIYLFLRLANKFAQLSSFKVCRYMARTRFVHCNNY